LLGACHNLVKIITWDIQYQHIKGHQDTSHPTVLSRAAWLNIEANLLAKERITPQHQGPLGFRIPYEPWHLEIAGKRSVKNPKQDIRKALNGPPARAYWKGKMPNLSPGLEELDLCAMERAMQEAPAYKRRWVSKQITGQFAHGKNMLRRGQRSTAQCPRCNKQVEDKQHIIRCPTQSARQQWTTSLNKLKQWLRAQGTEPEVRETLLSNLEAWSNDTLPEPSTASTPLRDEQTKIGWDRLLDGWLSQYWRSQQEKSWSQVRSRKSSRRWTSALIKKLWDISWDMWDHRNQELHSGGIEHQQILHLAVDDQIHQAYEGGAQQLPRDALHLIQTPKATVLQYPLELKQLWLESVHVAQKR